jgi:hypothetical protein
VPGGGGVHAHWCYPWVDVLLVGCGDGIGGGRGIVVVVGWEGRDGGVVLTDSVLEGYISDF